VPRSTADGGVCIDVARSSSTTCASSSTTFPAKTESRSPSLVLSIVLRDTDDVDRCVIAGLFRLVQW